MKLVPPSLPRSSYVPSSFGLYCRACFGILFVSILSTCCSHFFWYCFISFTMFCASVFCLTFCHLKILIRIFVLMFFLQLYVLYFISLSVLLHCSLTHILWYPKFMIFSVPCFVNIICVIGCLYHSC